MGSLGLAPLAISLLLGVAVSLVYEGLTNPAPFDPGEAARRRLRAASDRLAEFLAAAGLPDVSPREFLGGSLLAGRVVGAVTELVLGWPLVALVGFGIGLGLPFGYYARRRDRRRAATQAQIADAIDQLRLSVEAGRSIPEGLLALASHGPSSLRPEFAALARDGRLVGLAPALRAAKARLADPVFDVVAAALILSEESGGRNLTSVLAELARAVRAQVRVAEEVRAQQARTRFAAQIIALLPVVVLMLVRLIASEYLAIYDTLIGQVVIGLAALLIAVGYVAMLQLGKLPGDERVFRERGA